MKAGFDWRSEDELTQSQGVSEPAPIAERHYRSLTVIVAAVALLLALIIWALARQEQRVVGNMRSELLLAFELQREAAGTNDWELYSALLTQDDRAWRREQQTLFSADLIDDRNKIGLKKAAGSPLVTEITLSPDLSRARLTFSQAYAMGSSSDEGELVELGHTLAYRWEGQGWRLFPADAAFWGSWQRESGDFVSLTYPERDSSLAGALLQQLESSLATMCRHNTRAAFQAAPFCNGERMISIRLNDDPRTLLSLADNALTSSGEFDYDMPAPTLVGVPVGTMDYASYLQLWTEPVLEHVGQRLLAAERYPNQDIYALCFRHPLPGRYVYRYDLAADRWSSLVGQQAFSYLSALPDDSAVLLATDREVGLLTAKEPSDSAAGGYELGGRLPMSATLSINGWIERENGPLHLLQMLPTDGESPGYAAFDVSDCRRDTCAVNKLPGYPAMPEGVDLALYLTASQLFLGDSHGRLLHPLGKGFSPFWLDDGAFGFANFAREDDGTLVSQVVLGRTSNDDVQIVLNGHDLAQAAGLEREGGLFVNAVVPDPADSSRLLVSSTGIGDFAGHYYLFTAELAGDQQPTSRARLKLELTRRGTQGGVPGPLSPTGLSPFLVSADGRWLAMTELSDRSERNWTVVVHDRRSGVHLQLGENVPAMPGSVPLLDWSRNSQWLVVADRRYFHLWAPEEGYQETITHEFDVCTHIAWAD